MEIIALKSIYPDVYRELKRYKPSAAYSFSIEINSERASKVIKSIVVHFVLGVDYPETELKITTSDEINVTPEQKNCLVARIGRVLAANRGEPVVHNIVLETKELLDGFDQKCADSAACAKEEQLQRKIVAEIERKRRENSHLPETRAAFVTDEGGYSESVGVGGLSEEETSEEATAQGGKAKPGSHKRLSRYQSDFEEIAKIGKGAFGVVYKVRNRLDGLIYAVKQIILRKNSPAGLERLLREVKAIARITHPNVVRYYQSWIERPAEGSFAREDSDSSSDVFSFGESDYLSSEYDDDFASKWEFESSLRHRSPDVARQKTSKSSNERPSTLFIQMEFCRGRTLLDTIESEKTPKNAEIWRMFLQLIDVVSFIHSKNTIHRDIKPTNIFLDGQNNIKIGDFGLAILRSSTSPENAQNLSEDAGTPFYRAPEQASAGNPITAKADLYPVGIILLELCARFGTLMERNIEVRRLREFGKLNSDLKKTVNSRVSLGRKGGGFEVSALIERLASRDPAKRPGSVEELVSLKLMPLEMVDSSFDVALSELSKPKSTFKNKALKKLFAAGNPPHFEYTYDALCADRPMSIPASDAHRGLFALKDAISRKMRKVFRTHGLVEFETPLLSPTTSAKRGGVPLLDTDGNVVFLPSSNLADMARHCALNDTRFMKRFCLNRVYRENIAGSQPDNIMECHYDFLFACDEIENRNMRFSVYAEAIFTAIKLFERLFPQKAHELCISHQSLAGVLVARGCQKFNRGIGADRVMDFLAKNSAKNLRASRLKRFLATDLNLGPKSAEKFANFVLFKGKLADLETKLAEEFCRGELGSVYDEMRGATDFLSLMNGPEASQVQTSACVDTKMALSASVFCGLTIQIRDLGGEVYAQGGCYDKLIRRYSPSKSAGKTPSTKGFGVTLAFEKILIEIYENSAPLNINSKVVSVFSPENIFFEEKIRLCGILLQCGMQLEQTPILNLKNEITAINHCRETGIPWLVALSKKEMRDGLLRVHRVRRKAELALVAFSELRSWFRSAVSAAGEKKSRDQPPARAQNAVFLSGDASKPPLRDRLALAAHQALGRMADGLAKDAYGLFVTELRLPVIRKVNGLVLARRLGEVAKMEVAKTGVADAKSDKGRGKAAIAKLAKAVDSKRREDGNAFVFVYSAVDRRFDVLGPLFAN